MTESPTLRELLERLNELSPAETQWVLGGLAALAPQQVASALDRLTEYRAQTPTVRGGPALDRATEDEYRAEQNDHDPEENT